jgi:hypothetical protein
MAEEVQMSEMGSVFTDHLKKLNMYVFNVVTQYHLYISLLQNNNRKLLQYTDTKILFQSFIKATGMLILHQTLITAQF